MTKLPVVVPGPLRREYPPQGLIHGVLVDAVERELATRTGIKRGIDLLFQVEWRRKDGRRFILKRTTSRSMAPKSALRRLLEVWRGKRFDDDELEGGLVLDYWIGRTAKLIVSHRPPRVGFNDPMVCIEEVLPPDPGVFVTTEDYVRRRDRRPVIREGIAVDFGKVKEEA